VGVTVPAVACWLRIRILDARINDVRDNAPHGILCELRILVARFANIGTAWP
jgi:hypothetical protein